MDWGRHQTDDMDLRILLVGVVVSSLVRIHSFLGRIFALDVACRVGGRMVLVGWRRVGVGNIVGMAVGSHSLVLVDGIVVLGCIGLVPDSCTHLAFALSESTVIDGMAAEYGSLETGSSPEPMDLVLAVWMVRHFVGG